ncbi:hypothetical protein [Niveibacterium sp.]|uniref:hypothetical protein n=1 Tax=Niveibacterium sp. TaxID=2017444 RepID=UPI0035B4AB4E
MFTTRSRAVALATLTSLALLAGCGSSSNDNKPDAPTGFKLTPGDGRIYVTWDDQSATTDLRYWLFSARTTSMTRDDYRKYPDARVTAPVTTGFALTGLTNGLDYAMFMNATHGNGPGGAETETLTAKPRPAADNWAAPIDVDVRASKDGAINDITTFLTYYIAVGADGAIVYSTDPRKNWTAATVAGAPTASLNGVASNTTMAVAVGDNGSVYYTTDAVNWTAGAVTWASGTTGTAVKLNKVTMAPDSAFVAVGDNGVIVRTTDGINWTELTSAQKPTSLAANLNAIRNLNGTAVIVGDNGTLLKSATTSDLSAVGVVVGTGTSKNLRALLYYSGYYLAAGSEGELIISTDLTTWHHQSDFGTTSTINGLALGSRLLAVGNDGTIRIGVFSSSSATDAFFTWSAPVPSEAGNVSPTGNLLSVSGTSAGFVVTTFDGKTVSAF